MKTFIDYLIESKEDYKYNFMIKVAGDLPENAEECMETCLQKYQVSKFSKVKTTPIQPKLLDFPNMENVQVTIFEAELEYPATSAVLTNYIAEQTGISVDRIRVRSPREEAEAALNVENIDSEDKKGPLLTQDYEKTNFQKLVGDKGVSNFLKDLAKVRKEHQPTQYKGVNDELLAKSFPKEKPSVAEKEKPTTGLFGSIKNPMPVAKK